MSDRSEQPAAAIRAATRGDLPAIVAMIRALAEYERLSHLCVADELAIATALFGPEPVAEVIVARENNETVGFAVFFHHFSTFLGRRGLWLEDLFVQPSHRRRGYGRALLVHLAGLARDRGCGRFEWTVLDWNRPAIDFYRSLGADVLDDWRIVRMTGAALSSLAAQGGAEAPPVPAAEAPGRLAR